MTPGTHRFYALDALRGLCAVFVCLFHFHAVLPAALGVFVGASWQFVDFFFVLSGFVIAANYRGDLEIGLRRRRFIALRIARIYPLHVFVLALFVATELAGLWFAHGALPRQPFDAAHAPVAIPLNLLMLQSIGLLPRLTWNNPAWSIAAEFWAYVAFAVLIPAAGRRSDVILVAAAIACPLILLAATPFGINVTWDWALVRCFYGFALGVLCWTGWQATGRAPATHRWLWLAAELAVIAAVGAFVVATQASRWNLVGPPLFAAAVLVFAHERGAVSRVLVSPPLLLLGTLSYSIYMIHTYVQGRIGDVLKLIEHHSQLRLTTTVLHNGAPLMLVGTTPRQGLLLVATMLLIVVVVGYGTYLGVERPVMRWTRRRLRRGVPA